jgi:hypothetical protein
MNRKTSTETTTRPVARGTLVGISEAGDLEVQLNDRSGRILTCDVLEAAGGLPLRLGPGDTVLVHEPTAPEERGCVLGKVARYRDSSRRAVELVAEDGLTLRCGGASVTLKKTGKILLKGIDIVSHARRKQRLRGGSIQLN